MVLWLEAICMDRIDEINNSGQKNRQTTGFCNFSNILLLNDFANEILLEAVMRGRQPFEIMAFPFPLSIQSHTRKKGSSDLLLQRHGYRKGISQRP